MVLDVDYKPLLSISIPADQRQLFYRSLAKIRQYYPFATKSALVVQAVIAAAQQEQQLIELLAHLPSRYKSPSKKDQPSPRTVLGTRGLHQACSRRFRKRLVLSCELSPLLLCASLLVSLARAAALPYGEGWR